MIGKEGKKEEEKVERYGAKNETKKKTLLQTEEKLFLDKEKEKNKHSEKIKKSWLKEIEEINK